MSICNVGISITSLFCLLFYLIVMFPHLLYVLSYPPGYVTMGAVTPGHWSQQAFAAQTPLAFGVQSPLGPVAQVLPGGQPLIWGQANIFPATQQQWAAMAAGAFSPTAYLPAQPVGTLPAAMFQTLTPVTTVTPAGESHSGAGASASAPSPSASSSPQHGERARKMGKEMFKVGSCGVKNLDETRIMMSKRTLSSTLSFCGHHAKGESSSKIANCFIYYMTYMLHFYILHFI